MHTHALLNRTAPAAPVPRLFAASLAGVLLALGLLWSPPATASATEKPCRLEVRAKRFARAAKCYKNLYDQVDQHPQWRKDAPLYKDRFLRHAALCYRLSAKSKNQLGVKGYLKEQAIKLLRTSFERGFCEASQRCRANRLLADQLNQEIGYAPLSIVTDEPKAKIIVKGYQFHEERYQNYTRKIRPGKYSVTIIHPTRGTKKRAIAMRPNHTTSINATEARIKIIEKRIIIAKKIPPLVLAGYIGGGILAAVGTVLIAFSVAEQNNLNAVWRDPEKNKDLTEEEYQTRFGNAETTKIVGGVLGGLGILFLAGGAIAHLAANASTPKRRVEVRPASPLDDAPPTPRGKGQGFSFTAQ